MTDTVLGDRRTVWIVAVLIIVLFATANLPWQLDDYDQAKQAFSSFEMVKEGHWLYQHTPHERIATKPPLIGWISAGIFSVARSWEVAWRLPSLLSAIGLSILLFRAGSVYGPAHDYAGGMVWNAIGVAKRRRHAAIDARVDVAPTGDEACGEGDARLLAAEVVPARPRAKTREGVVVSNKMNKTAVVSVARRTRHGKYLKTVVRHKHYMVHDEQNACRPGDRVIIAETRPMSKLKRWRLSRIVEQAVQLGGIEVADVAAAKGEAK